MFSTGPTRLQRGVQVVLESGIGGVCLLQLALQRWSVNSQRRVKACKHARPD